MKKRFNAKAIMIGLASLAAGAAVSVPALMPGQALAATEATEAVAAEAKSEELVSETEKKTVVWTIRAVYKQADGSTKPVKTSDGSEFKVTRSATFTRTVTKNKTTGKVVSAGSWAAPVKLADYTAPSIPGYTPDKATVTGITVSHDSKPEDTIIYYTENPENKKTSISESKEVKRKITYYRVNDDGSVSPTWSKTQTVTFTRVGTVDGNGKKSFNSWNSYTWEAEDVSGMTGYTPDITVIPAVTFTPDNPPKDVAVYFRKNAETITDGEDYIKPGEVVYSVTFKDGQGKTISSDQVEEGKAAKAPAAPKREGYTFAGWDKKFDKVTDNLVVNAKWEKNKTEWITESKTVKRTIKYFYADGSPVIATDGKPAVETDTATFNRKGLKDLVTGKITQWTDWSPALKFDARNPLKVQGYTASVAKIPAATVTADTKSWEIKVYYSKNGSSSKVSVSGISLNKTTASLAKNATVTLKATVKPDNATNKKVIWSSSNSSVAKVDSNGKVTALKRGKAVITAKTADGSKTAKCTVTVTYTGIMKVNGVLTYCRNSKPDYSFTGVSPSTDGVIRYVKKGKFDTSYKGVGKAASGNKYYIVKGLVANKTCAVKDTDGKWIYVKNGKFTKAFTGAVMSTDGKIRHMKDGRHNTSFTGISTAASGNRYYMVKGEVASGYTGYVGNLYVKNGRVVK